MQSRPCSDINITPLIDIVLVLLIVFIVMVPAIAKGYTPQLAGVSTTGAPALSGPVRLALEADGALRLEDAVLPDAELEAQLRQALASRASADRKVVLKVSDALPFQRAVDLLARLHQADPELPVILR
jgi:biopolymer transport protein ExbD